MKIFHLFFSVFILIGYGSSLPAQDTFSIVAIDPQSGEIGSAGASCIPGAAGFGGVIILSGILPGRGAVNAQAYICISPHVNLLNAIDQLERGASPQETIDWLIDNDRCFSQNYNSAFRQYGIVDFSSQGQPRSAAFTGAGADEWKGHRTGDTYAIQGNILKGPEVLDSMESRFLRTPGTLAERLMAAMQGANVVGADARCASAGTSSTSAFLRVFKPDDNRNHPYLELNVAEAPRGVEPIDSLQRLFDRWRQTGGSDPAGLKTVRVFPNPANGQLRVQNLPEETVYQIKWYDLNGRLLLEEKRDDGLVTAPKATGIFILRVLNPEGRLLYSGRQVLTP